MHSYLFFNNKILLVYIHKYIFGYSFVFKIFSVTVFEIDFHSAYTHKMNSTRKFCTTDNMTGEIMSSA